MKMLNGIRWRALGIAVFAFYLAPILPLVVMTSIPNFFGFDPSRGHRLWQTPFVLVLAWFYAVAPVGSGYFAAKLARQQPLLHGLLIGVTGSVLALLWSQGPSYVFKASLALLIASCGLFGGWLWRHRNGQTNTAL
jgi:hypothetical protein